MNSSHSIKWGALILSLFISLGAGGLSTLITGDSKDVYKTLNLPPLAPPSFVFPVVWTILFILMGVSAYLIWRTDLPGKKGALILYGIQLVVNMAWTPIFFKTQAFLFAFIWLVFLWILIVAMIRSFYKISPVAAYLQIPYLLWVTFAGYLNLGIYLLNK